MMKRDLFDRFCRAVATLVVRAELSAMPTREILWLLDERDRRKRRDEGREMRGLVERRQPCRERGSH
jgi:hypothetical protein